MNQVLLMNYYEFSFITNNFSWNGIILFEFKPLLNKNAFSSDTLFLLYLFFSLDLKIIVKCINKLTFVLIKYFH